MAKKKRGGKRGKSKKSRDEPPPLEAIEDSLSRARSWLAERRDYYGFLSRRDRKRGAPEMAGHLRGDMLARQESDGSWGDDLVVTADAVWQLLDLGVHPSHGSIDRAVTWLYDDRRDAEGAYGEGCTPARHEQGTCEHYLSGFFSPAPPDESYEIELANGQTVNSDASARLLASERALRTLLRVNADDLRARDSVDGLRGVPLYLEYGGTFTPAVLVGAVQALARAQGAPGELSAGLDTLSKAQEKDGTWPNVELFFVLETLLEVDPRRALPMLEKALPGLLKSQHKYGAWGRKYLAAQTWIAVQVLEIVKEARKALAT